MSELPINTTTNGPARWHTIDHDPRGHTRAMNTPNGAIVLHRTSAHMSGSESSTLLPGTTVAQRWTAEAIEADESEGIKARVLLIRELALVKSEDVGARERPVIRIDLDRCEFVGINSKGTNLRPSTRSALHKAMVENMTIDDALRRAMAVVGDICPKTVRVVNTGESGRSTVEADIGASPPAPTWISADDDLPRPSDAEIRAMAGVEAEPELPEGWSWLSDEGSVAMGPDDQRAWIHSKEWRGKVPHVEFMPGDRAAAPVAVVEAVIAQWRKRADR